MKSHPEKYGPWALVTGASSGMGEQFARQLAAIGLNLVLVARRRENLENLAEELEFSTGVDVRIADAALSKTGFLDKIAKATSDIEIGLLVNNAGRGLTGDFLDNDPQIELEMLRLNSEASMQLAHAYGSRMRKRRKGGIIFLSSITAFAGIPVWSNYAATKAYALLLAEGLAHELKSDNVDVLAVCPGSTLTEFMNVTAFGRLVSMKAEKVVESAIRSLGKRSLLIPGIPSKLAAFSARFLPRFLNSVIFRFFIRSIQQT